MTYTRIEDDGTLIIHLFKSEFESILDEARWGIVNLNDTQYRDILYDTNATIIDFYNAQEDITIKQLWDRHKIKITKISFVYKEGMNIIHRLTFNKPNWEINGNIIKLTWYKKYSYQIEKGSTELAYYG